MNIETFDPEQIATIDAAMSKSLEALRRAESVVTALVDIGADSHAALYAQASAHRACYAHAGVFASAAIELALAKASARPGTPTQTRSTTLERRRVLHIATQLAYPEGGHTRLLLRWIRSDTSCTHSLAVTMPRYEIPPVLDSSVFESRGKIYRPAPGSSSFMARALDLRQIAAGFDIIVLHIHPFDPLPILALSWPNRPPTIFLNHAPHLFWLGRSISDVVTFGRDAAKEICVARRGIDPDACFFLPVVIDPENTKATARDDIRRELQVGARDLLLITVASESKLQTVGSHDLGETVIEAISADPNIVWRVVGPSPNGRWAEFAERTEGRVRAVGVRDDHGLYAAADVFVDSYPFASRTAMFDAAAAGIPLLAPRWHPPAATILSSWGSPVDAAILPFDDELSLARQLRILRKEKTRRRWGRLAAERISESYRATWVARLNDLYAFAAERASLRNDLGSARHPLPAETQPNDLDRYLRQIYSVTEVQRVLLGWHRIETNFRADVTFPAEEASLAESTGLAAFIGEQSLTIRDHEARIVDLEQMLAAQSPGSA